MAIENDPSSRMQVRGRGSLMPPASCYVCGNGSHDGGYIDFGTFVDYHGNFYLCMTCAEQLAMTIGWVSPDLMESVTRTAAETNERLRETEEELADARKHINSLNDVLTSKYSASNADLSDRTSDTFLPYEPEGDLNPIAAANGRESEPAKSVKGSRRTDTSGPKPRNFAK